MFIHDTLLLTVGMDKTFAENIINYTLPDKDNELDKKCQEAISQYLQTGLVSGDHSQVKAIIQPMMRFRLLFQVASSLGFDSAEMDSAERIPYGLKLSARFNMLLSELQPWYGPARALKGALSPFAQVEDDLSVWKEGSVNQDQESFAQNIGNLVKSTLNSKLAVVHRVRANLEILAYMVKWHMTVCSKLLYLLLISSNLYLQHNTSFPHSPDGFIKSIIK